MSGKLMPRGAVTMWSAVGGMPTSYTAHQVSQQEGAAPPPNANIVGRRSDWAAGRIMTAEEKRAAMLTTVTEANHSISLRKSLKHLKENPNVSAQLTATPPKRLHAVVKAEMGDWQVNEIDEDGDAVLLTRRPKGRWVKVSKDKRTKVEVDTTEEWYLPHKAYIERVVNYGRYRQMWGDLPAQRPVLKLSLYRESTPLSAVFRRTAHRCGVRGEQFDYVSPKESFGCVTQHVSTVGVHSERLLHANRHYNLRAIIFNPLSHGSESNVVTNCGGNHWRVLLRCVEGSSQDVERRIAAIKEDGFVNYVPLNDFSIASNTASEIHSAASNGHFVDACRFWLQSEAERNPLIYEHYIKYVSSSKDTTAGILERMKSDADQYRLRQRLGPFLDALIRASKDGSVEEQADQLWAAVPLEDRQSLASAPSSFVWNAMTSQRILSGGSRVAAGDLVLDPKTNAVRHVQVGEEDKWTPFDIVLPFPNAAALYPTHGPVSKQLYDRLIEEHRLASSIQAFNESLWTPRVPTYRRILSRPIDLSWESIDDPNSLTVLKTDRFIREERRPVGLGFESERIRRPTPLNVSPRFREEMQPRIHHALSGEQSVALSFTLKDGAHPLCLLREGFVTRHAYFHDLLTPQPSDGFRALVKTTAPSQ